MCGVGQSGIRRGVGLSGISRGVGLSGIRRGVGLSGIRRERRHIATWRGCSECQSTRHQPR